MSGIILLSNSTLHPPSTVLTAELDTPRVGFYFLKFHTTGLPEEGGAGVGVRQCQVTGTLLTIIMTYRRRRAAGNGGRHSSRRSRSSHRSRSGGGRRGGGGTPGRSPSRSRRSRADATAEVEVRGSHQVGCWPHGQSFLFASLGVVLGMFSISRFVVLTIDFGGESSLLTLRSWVEPGVS